MPDGRWIGLADPEDKGRKRGFMKPESRPGIEWRGVRVPGNFGAQFADLAGFGGLFWYRLEFELPKGGGRCGVRIAVRPDRR
ncbi:MAG TPA: hypothetical protein DFL85_08125 [Lentisphaeria bacterium]|nr:hypothetical protein [Lentisphaeria bacterium]HCH85465.1 hypothetical protein [Lentisphaeria bacterium]